MNRIGNPLKRFPINFGAICCQRRQVRLRLCWLSGWEYRQGTTMDSYQGYPPIHHPRPAPRNNNLVSEEVNEFIRQNALRMTSPQLYHQVCRQFGLVGQIVKDIQLVIKTTINSFYITSSPRLFYCMYRADHQERDCFSVYTLPERL
ncbi:unnamed protein product [Absidia cylindrospora]